jgi:hypothetical protein
MGVRLWVEPHPNQLHRFGQATQHPFIWTTGHHWVPSQNWSGHDIACSNRYRKGSGGEPHYRSDTSYSGTAVRSPFGEQVRRGEARTSPTNPLEPGQRALW